MVQESDTVVANAYGCSTVKVKAFQNWQEYRLGIHWHGS